MKIILSNDKNEIEFFFAEDLEEALNVLVMSKKLLEDALTAGVEITLVKD